PCCYPRALSVRERCHHGGAERLHPPAPQSARVREVVVGAYRARDGESRRGLERVGRDRRRWVGQGTLGIGRTAASGGTEAEISDAPRALGQILEAVKRYDVRWAQLDPAQGAEMPKTRPVVIVSLDALNERLQTVAVCPLTSQLHPAWRTRLGVRVSRKNAEIAVDQIRTISKSRIGEKLGKLSDS